MTELPPLSTTPVTVCWPRLDITLTLRGPCAGGLSWHKLAVSADRYWVPVMPKQTPVWLPVTRGCGSTSVPLMLCCWPVVWVQCFLFR